MTIPDSQRLCTCCNSVQPISAFYTFVHKKHGPWTRRVCKSCDIERRKQQYRLQYVAHPKPAPFTERQCPQCHVVKPRIDFLRNIGGGRLTTKRLCKACVNRNNYLRNKDAVIAKAKKNAKTERYREWKRKYKRAQRKKYSKHESHVLTYKAWVQEQTRRARAERSAFLRTMSDADKYRHRYSTDETFAARERERSKKRKATVPLYYANQMLGGTRQRKYPTELLLAKQVELRIARLIKEST